MTDADLSAEQIDGIIERDVIGAVQKIGDRLGPITDDNVERYFHLIAKLNECVGRAFYPLLGVLPDSKTPNEWIEEMMFAGMLQFASNVFHNTRPKAQRTWAGGPKTITVSDSDLGMFAPEQKMIFRILQERLRRVLDEPTYAD